ncbi:hypothetical protein [Nonomuraea endophytica]|uniref:L-ascorbate metabolism protein UlaG (Beta-lactamase superfamily) n=1 Tax=Nonomuraea endophytica TaxID=714136 RepID=A0A7W8EH97_9ACTN|nr:hypothetical protein [Nonomuraea endophytica]MBB5080710.1 L-ascorbate metabolism protein UlaG (beta-lactamase superfamily) [Nonomuraea endophytica]
MIKPSIALTRVVNSCGLLELDGHAVLTDPPPARRWTSPCSPSTACARCPAPAW